MRLKNSLIVSVASFLLLAGAGCSTPNSTVGTYQTTQNVQQPSEPINTKVDNAALLRRLNDLNGQSAPVSPPTTQAACVHTNTVQFSATEESRKKEIVLSVMQGGADMPTPAIYNEFWSILNKSGNLCAEDITSAENDATAIGECTYFFYQDALQSLRTGQAYKSPERADCENKTITALLPANQASARIQANQNLIGKIAAGLPITTASGDVVFTEEMIQSSLDGISAKLDRLNKLFIPTPSPFFNNSPTQSSVDPSIHITRNPALDKECEEEHGPSVYKSMPKSIGGGAYCDCKPGYTLRPTVVDGQLSSWCVQE